MPKNDKHLKARLARAGIDEDVTNAAIEIDAVLQRWRRQIFKRELGTNALRELGMSIDLAQLDVLMAVHGPRVEFDGNAKTEVMVTTVGERLNIDRSRASRLTSDLITQGFLRRAVSQSDARRAILELTDKGTQVVRAVRSYKFLILGQFLKGWTEEEIETFVPLLARFSTWYDGANSPSGEVEEEVAALRQMLLDNEKSHREK